MGFNAVRKKVEEEKGSEGGPSTIKHKDTMPEESLDFLLIKYHKLNEEMEYVKQQNLTPKVRWRLKCNPFPAAHIDFIRTTNVSAVCIFGVGESGQWKRSEWSTGTSG